MLDLVGRGGCRSVLELFTAMVRRVILQARDPSYMGYEFVTAKQVRLASETG